jgi:predicted lysophospholipase L1 biosynthesis ABC-type transport system permease subunit
MSQAYWSTAIAYREPASTLVMHMYRIKLDHALCLQTANRKRFLPTTGVVAACRTTVAHKFSVQQQYALQTLLLGVCYSFIGASKCNEAPVLCVKFTVLCLHSALSSFLLWPWWQ